MLLNDLSITHAELLPYTYASLYCKCKYMKYFEKFWPFVCTLHIIYKKLAIKFTYERDKNKDDICIYS